MLEDFLKNKFLDFLLKIFLFFLKFGVIYYFLGMISVFICFFCMEITGYFVYGMDWSFGKELVENFDPFNLIDNIKYLFLNKIPFADLLNGIFVGGIYVEELSDIWKVVTNVEKNVPWNTVLSNMLPNVTQTSLAGLVFFCLSRLNRILKIFGEKEYNFALFLVSLLWTASCFFITVMIMEGVRYLIPLEFQSFAYWILLIFSFFIHAIFLKCSDLKMWTVSLYLLLDLVFCVINSCCIWIFCNFSFAADSIFRVILNFYGFSAVLFFNGKFKDFLFGVFKKTPYKKLKNAV